MQKQIALINWREVSLIGETWNFRELHMQKQIALIKFSRWHKYYLYRILVPFMEHDKVKSIGECIHVQQEEETL